MSIQNQKEGQDAPGFGSRVPGFPGSGFFHSANILFMVLLFLPILQRQVRILPRISLFGVEEQAQAVPFTWKNWFDGGYQLRAEIRHGQRLGIRAHLIRTDNQINFSLFGKIRQKSGTRVVFGNHGNLFENAYIRQANRPRQAAGHTVTTVVERVRQFQDICRAQGLGFVLLIAPSKASLYPEDIPARLRYPANPPTVPLYEQMIPRLRAAGVSIVDARALFLQWKKSAPYPLFPKGGTHWSYYGAARVVQALIAELESQTGANFPDLQISGVDIDDKPYREEADLVTLLNLWRWKSLTGPQYHPRLKLAPDPAARPARLLMIGDSFFFSIADLLDTAKIIERMDGLYYFRRRFVYPGGANTPFDRKDIDIRAELRGRDAVIIEINEYWLPDIGFLFLEHALETFTTNSVPVQSSREFERPESPDGP